MIRSATSTGSTVIRCCARTEAAALTTGLSVDATRPSPPSGERTRALSTAKCRSCVLPSHRPLTFNGGIRPEPTDRRRGRIFAGAASSVSGLFNEPLLNRLRSHPTLRNPTVQVNGQASFVSRIIDSSKTVSDAHRLHSTSKAYSSQYFAWLSEILCKDTPESTSSYRLDGKDPSTVAPFGDLLVREPWSNNRPCLDITKPSPG